MRFGTEAVAAAAGGLLGHTLRGPDFVFKKGRALSAADTARLAAAGIREVMVARLDAGDVGEDAAAAACADAITGPGVTAAAPSNGRCDLRAVASGLLQVNAAAIDAINAVDEAVTVATRATDARVDAGERVATVKIIPFAVGGETLAACLARAAAHPPVLAVQPFAPRQVGLIQTTLPGLKPSVHDKTIEVTAARLARIGSTLMATEIVAHDAGCVAAALAALVRRGCSPLLIVGASAIVDRLDIIPAAIVAAGGEVEHFGMPVEPGNLLLIGRLGGAAVVGLPGCARSPKANGFDWVLQRLCAGLPVGRADIVRLGVGGLLERGAETDGDRRPAVREAGR